MHNIAIEKARKFIQPAAHLLTHGMLLLVSEARISGVRRVPADLPSTVTGGVGDWAHMGRCEKSGKTKHNSK